MRVFTYPANADVFPAVVSLPREKRPPEIRLRSQAKVVIAQSSSSVCPVSILKRLLKHARY